MTDVVIPSHGWVKAFIAMQHELPKISRDKTVRVRTKNDGEFQYSYADLASIIEAVEPVLRAHGFAIVQEVSSGYDAMGSVGVITRIYHIDGHCERFGPLYLPAGDDPQSAGSAITYARRYALTAALGIATETDDDAQSFRGQSQDGPPVTADDPHCPACLQYNGELVRLTKEKTKAGKDYWRCANRGRDCAGFTSKDGKDYSLSLWVEADDDPDDWQTLSTRWLRSKGVFPLDENSVGPEVVVYVRDQVVRTTGMDDQEPDDIFKVNDAVYIAVSDMVFQGILDESIVEKGEKYDEIPEKLKAIAMAIPYRFADQWIAIASTELLGKAVSEEEE